jgi:hypothetical protein
VDESCELALERFGGASGPGTADTQGQTVPLFNIHGVSPLGASFICYYGYGSREDTERISRAIRGRVHVDSIVALHTRRYDPITSPRRGAFIQL